MKTYINNSIKTIMAAMVIIAGFFAMASFAQASASFANGYYDTLRAANHTDNPFSINWDDEGATTASLNPGDQASFSIFYQNTGTSTAQNVRVRLSPQSTGSASAHSFTATVSSSNTSTITGNATVTVRGGSSQSLTFLPGVSKFYRNSWTVTSPLANLDSDLFSSAGVLVGNVEPGGYGFIVVAYRMSGTQTPVVQNPTVVTLSVEDVTPTSAIINGSYNAQGNTVATYFVYATSVAGLATGMETQSVTQTNSGQMAASLTNLTPNTTYFYRACARNLSNNTVICGVDRQFTTTGNAVETMLSVATQSPQNVSTNSVTLRGQVTSGNNATVWFVMGTNSNISCTTATGSQTYSVNGLFNNGNLIERFTSGLASNTTYFYRVCAQNGQGVVSGDRVQFTTNQQPSQDVAIGVNTLAVNNLLSNSATLRGQVTSGNNVSTWFVMSTNSNVSCTSSPRYDVSGTYFGGNTFNFSVSNLVPSTTYFYRACGQNNQGIAEGARGDFRTPQQSVNNNTLPVASACSLVSAGQATATIRAAYASNTNATGYFQYGTSTAFGSATTTRTYAGTGLAQEVISGLQPNTQYFCQFVITNDAGVTRGDIGSFRTQAVPAAIGGGTTTVVRTVTTGGGNFVTLLINNNQEIATRGQTVQYVVEYSNISRQNLDQVGLLVRLPKAARFVSSDRGTYNRRDHTVYYRIGTFNEGQTDRMNIVVRIVSAREGEPIVAEAVLAFENPDDRGNAFINAIEFDADTYSAGVGLAAGLFGFGFPSTFGEWMLFLLLIVLLILVARYFYNSNREHNARMAAIRAQEQAHRSRYQAEQAGNYGNTFR
ncbi:MAG: fibronectin type III domain-containing protein [Candidatus Pacebacteria bacterium]|nr:fibronectin type III domain-containing protein [Candidatus Paceibacterota bacterium]